MVRSTFLARELRKHLPLRDPFHDTRSTMVPRLEGPDKASDQQDHVDDLAGHYLGPPDQVFAKTSDAVLVLEDGQLPAHRAYLCTDGVWGDMVASGLQSQENAAHKLRLPLPGCQRADVAQLLRIIYSHNRWEFSRTMSLKELQQAGLLADRFCMIFIKEAVEDAIMTLCCGPSRCDLDYEPSLLNLTNVFEVAEWAEHANSPDVAIMCGRFIGDRATELPGNLPPKQLVWVAAVCQAMVLPWDTESFTFQRPSGAAEGVSNWHS